MWIAASIDEVHGVQVTEHGTEREAEAEAARRLEMGAALSTHYREDEPGAGLDWDRDDR